MYRSRGLNRNMKPLRTKLRREFRNSGRNHGLTTGNHYVRGLEWQNGFDNFLYRKLAAFRFPGCIRSVAPNAAKVAAARPDENRRHTGKGSFPLNGIENFRYLHDDFFARAILRRRSDPAIRLRRILSFAGDRRRIRRRKCRAHRDRNKYA